MKTEILEVKTKRQQREFLSFPLKLYKNNKYYVPPLYLDEKKMFRDDFVYNENCIIRHYNAYKDNKMVGRITCLIQTASNQKWDQKRVRFTHFDVINDKEVAKALLDKVEQFAKENHMEEVVGPLGYSDLEREGLLIEGFDQPQTFEEQYNYQYYQDLIEDLGYKKEVDWIESQIYYPTEDNDRLEKYTKLVFERYKLHFIREKNVKVFIKKYGDDLFDVLDKTYENIYGTVPFTKRMKDMTIDNFKLALNMKYIAAIATNDNKIVCFGLCMPSLSKAISKSKGHLTIPAIFRLLKAIRKPEILDLALIGVLPEYESKGVASAILVEMKRMLRDDGIKYFETNLNLETNTHILNQWRNFKTITNKRRRCYIKQI